MDTVKYAYCHTCLDGAEVDIAPDGSMRNYGFAARHRYHKMEVIGTGFTENCIINAPVIRGGKVTIRGLFAGRHH